MDNLQKTPVKIYIQDIFRAEQNTTNKYIYEMFGLSFKNIMIHGVVTSIMVAKDRANFEISDPTGCVQVYYNFTKNNAYVSNSVFENLVQNFANISRFYDDSVCAMSYLLNSIEQKHKRPLDFVKGSYVSVVGDIFVDDLKSSRMVSAYMCKKTSIERDIIWMAELRYLYDKYYLSKT